jgi:hypothetical protein
MFHSRPIATFSIILLGSIIRPETHSSPFHPELTVIPLPNFPPNQSQSKKSLLHIISSSPLLGAISLAFFCRRRLTKGYIDTDLRSPINRGPSPWHKNTKISKKSHQRSLGRKTVKNLSKLAEKWKLNSPE